MFQKKRFEKIDLETLKRESIKDYNKAIEWLSIPEEERLAMLNSETDKNYKRLIYSQALDDPSLKWFKIPESIFFNIPGEFRIDGRPLINLPIKYKELEPIFSGLHYMKTGENYIANSIIRRSPTLLPKWAIKNSQYLRNKFAKYYYNTKEKDINVAFHEIASHGTDPLLLNANQYILYDVSDYLPTKRYSIESANPWETRATLNEYRLQIPNYKDLDYDSFVRILKSSPTNGYAQDYGKLSDEGLNKLYNAFINGYATGGKLKNNTTIK